jgi:hypothetical protein
MKKPKSKKWVPSPIGGSVTLRICSAHTPGVGLADLSVCRTATINREQKNGSDNEEVSFDNDFLPSVFDHGTGSGYQDRHRNGL